MAECGDRETLIQPGDWVHVKCTRADDHDGNHYNDRHGLEWGNHLRQEFGGQPFD